MQSCKKRQILSVRFFEITEKSNTFALCKQEGRLDSSIVIWSTRLSVMDGRVFLSDYRANQIKVVDLQKE